MEVTQQDFIKYLNPKIASKLSSLELKAKFIVEGFMLGLHRSPYHGFSIEFSQHRQYMQGDEFKDIDWKVYGKTDKYFIKQYEEETNLKCYIILDVSKSMNFSSQGNITKLEYAKMLSASLSYLMLKQKDAVGLTLYSNEIKKYLQPKSSEIYLKEILTSLLAVEPSNNTQTSACLSLIAEKIKSRGLIIIISDFFDELNSVLNSFKHFSFKKNDVIVFQVLDPIEKNFSFQRDSIFIDLETNEELTTQPQQIQKAYKDAMDEFLHKIKNECLNTGIEYNLIETNKPFDKALFSYLQKRTALL